MCVVSSGIASLLMEPGAAAVGAWQDAVSRSDLTESVQLGETISGFECTLRLGVASLQ